jgi:hypothetical protein
MKHRYILSALACAIFSLSGLSATAAVPEGTARIIHTQSDLQNFLDEEEEDSTTFFSSESGNVSSNSTMYFNDDTGALIAFELETSGDEMELTIRQNGCVVWKNSYTDTNHTYRITRRTFNGSTYFLIYLGHRILRASNTPDGHWNVESAPFGPTGSDSEPSPL